MENRHANAHRANGGQGDTGMQSGKTNTLSIPRPNSPANTLAVDDLQQNTSDNLPPLEGIAVELSDERSKPYVWITHDVIDSFGPVIGAVGLGVYLAIARTADWAKPGQERGNSFRSINTLCKSLGMSKPTFLKHLAALEKCGLLRIDRRTKAKGDHDLNCYTLTDPPQPKKNTNGGGKESLPPSENSLPGVVKNFQGGGKESLPYQESLTENHNKNHYQQQPVLLPVPDANPQPDAAAAVADDSLFLKKEGNEEIPAPAADPGAHVLTSGKASGLIGKRLQDSDRDKLMQLLSWLQEKRPGHRDVAPITEYLGSLPAAGHYPSRGADWTGKAGGLDSGNGRRAAVLSAIGARETLIGGNTIDDEEARRKNNLSDWWGGIPKWLESKRPNAMQVYNWVLDSSEGKLHLVTADTPDPQISKLDGASGIFMEACAIAGRDATEVLNEEILNRADRWQQLENDPDNSLLKIASMLVVIGEGLQQQPAGKPQDSKDVASMVLPVELSPVAIVEPSPSVSEPEYSEEDMESIRQFDSLINAYANNSDRIITSTINNMRLCADQKKVANLGRYQTLLTELTAQNNTPAPFYAAV